MFKKIGIAFSLFMLMVTGSLVAANPALATTCAPYCYYYSAGRSDPAVPHSGWYAAMDIYKPTMNTSKGDGHTLMELTVENPSVGNTMEIGWVVDSTGGSPKLFTGTWVNHNFLGYNVGLGSVSTCGGVTPTLTPGSTVPGTYPQLKKFGIQHNGTWPTGAWWFAYDTGWAACITDSWLSSQGAVNFDSGTRFQGFGEVASTHDLSAGTAPCAQMGSGTKGSLTTTVSPTAARIANTQFADDLSFPTLTLINQGPGGSNSSTYYNTAALGTSGRSFYLGGTGATTNPPC